MNWTTRWAAAVVAVCLLAAGVIAQIPLPSGHDGYALAGETVFVDDELTEVFVTVDPADLQAILSNPLSDTYYPCTVRVVNSRIDITMEDVGIRLRGNTSRFAVKKSWKLKFNEYVSGRRFQGLKSFNLNGHQNDPSVVRGKLALDLYRAFGVPAPRASAMRLVINDGSIVDDVYIQAEQIDDLFMQAWFKNDAGNLYKASFKGERADLRYVAPGTAATYEALGSPTYELEMDNAGDVFEDLADFIAFIEFADDATFADEIVDWFSVDTFLRAMAVDCVNGHWDNIWYGANNFYLYANPATGVFEYIPFDLDNTYGTDFFSTDWATRPAPTFGDGGFGWDFDSTFGGGPMPPLVRRIFAIDAYRDQYLRYVRELVGAVGNVGTPPQTVFEDSVGDVFHSATEPHFDIVSVGVSNDEDALLMEVRVAGPVDVGGSTNQLRVMFFFDTRAGGSTTNPWGRQINTPVLSNYFLGSWTDNGGGFILYERTTFNWVIRHASFDNPGGVVQDLSSKAEGVVRYRVPLQRLGLTPTDTFSFDVVTTNDRGASFEPGLDHLSNPNQATPNYDTASQAGPYLVHTLTPFDPGEVGGVDGLFTLAPREGLIDELRTMLASFAFQGPLSGGGTDWGFTNQSFLDSYTQPSSYSGGQPWAWGIKPYIEARTAYLRASTPAPAALPAIAVNEVYPGSGPNAADGFIELYNFGDVAVDLSGMHLSDWPGAARGWQIPIGTVLAPGAFITFPAGGDGSGAPLRLVSTGGTVTLSETDANGVVLVSSLTFPGLGFGNSFGRYPDGSATLRDFCARTPGGANDPDEDCFVIPGPTPRVFINEWLASNSGIVTDEFGDPDDYIELYNDEDHPVDLGGRHLTDDLTNPTKWRIPDGVVIPAKGFLVIWADNEPWQGPLHAPFALSASGETIGLFDRVENGVEAIDVVVFGPQTTDVAQGRVPDGSDCRAFFTPSPGVSNAVNGADFFGNDVYVWVLSAVGDGFNSWASASGDIGNPGQFAISVPNGTGMAITEWMYGGSTSVGGEFVEFTNLSNQAIDMTGWSFNDDQRIPGVFDLSDFGVVEPGESVILTEDPAEDFRQEWGLAPSVKIVGDLGNPNGRNLGRNDEINLYDHTDALVARLTYGDQAFPGTIRTQRVSGNPDVAGCISSCPADLTGPALDGVPDGAVNAFDLNYYIGLWLANDPRADVTGAALDGVPDGAVNAFDLNYYVALWLAGCP